MTAEENVQRVRPDAAAIECIEVSKRYGEVTALESFTLEIAQKELVVLLGPSGCGKSTLLKIIAGLEDASEGDIYIDGALVNYVTPKNRDVAMVFQNYALYPHLRVRDNIGFPLKMRRVKREDIRTRVAEVARLVELEDHLGKYPEHLSGGQRQRVALARAMIRNPVAFLMDEPLSNLDAQLRTQTRDELLRLHRRVERTTVYVTHDQVEAMTMADRIVVMRHGRIQQVGPPQEVYRRPANAFVATFVGSPQMNLFAGRLVGAEVERRFAGSALEVGLGHVRLDAPEGTELTLGVRPEDLQVVGDGEDVVAGVVEFVESVGADAYAHVVLADGSTCIVRTPGSMVLSDGERVRLGTHPDRVHFFDTDGVRIPMAA